MIPAEVSAFNEYSGTYYSKYVYISTIFWVAYFSFIYKFRLKNGWACKQMHYDVAFAATDTGTAIDDTEKTTFAYCVLTMKISTITLVIYGSRRCSL